MYKGPGLYRHYKGGLYHVVGLATNEGTHKPFVVYFQVDDDGKRQLMPQFLKTKTDSWLRDLDDFNAPVETLNGTAPRFVFLDELI